MTPARVRRLLVLAHARLRLSILKHTTIETPLFARGVSIVGRLERIELSSRVPQTRVLTVTP